MAMRNLALDVAVHVAIARASGSLVTAVIAVAAVLVISVAALGSIGGM